MKLISAVFAVAVGVAAAPTFADSHSNATEATVMSLLRAVGALDVDAQLDVYAEDASIITVSKVYRGHDEIREFLEEFVDEFSQGEISMETNALVFEGNTGFVVWSAESEQNVYEIASDTYFVDGDKIVSHTFAAKVTSK